MTDMDYLSTNNKTKRNLKEREAAALTLVIPILDYIFIVDKIKELIISHHKNKKKNHSPYECDMSMA
jgi:hypothetical protein